MKHVNILQLNKSIYGSVFVDSCRSG